MAVASHGAGAGPPDRRLRLGGQRDHLHRRSDTVTVNQSSQNVAINWQTLHHRPATTASIFVQPDSSSVALNRVLGADPSVILGSLTANGKVFLVNPNGIAVRPGRAR